MQESPISDELLAILVCPESKLSLSIASDAVLTKLNKQIENGSAKSKTGLPVTRIITAGLLREDSKVLYPIVDGIPLMLIEEAIVLDN